MQKCKQCKGQFERLPYDGYCSARLCMEACINELEREKDKATYTSHVAGQKESIRRFTEFLAGMSGTIADATQKPDVVVNLQEEDSANKPDFGQLSLEWLRNHAHPAQGYTTGKIDLLATLLREQWEDGYRRRRRN